MLALLSPLIPDKHDDSDEPVDDPGDEDAHDDAEELATLLRWLQIDRFDRRAVNRRLAQLEMMLVRAPA